MLRTLSILLALSLIVGVAFSQSRRAKSGPGQRWEDVDFQPARVIYRTSGGGGSRGNFNPWWAIDYPEAEMNFLPALARMTKMSVSEDSRFLDVMDPAIFDHPFLFLQQPGRGNWNVTEEEAARFREYFARGGFLLVDDFHGEYEWETFEQTMHIVFPDREIIEIPEDDSLVHVFFSLDDRIQIPGKRHLRGRGSDATVSMQGPPHWRGVYDPKGRLQIGINFNMDMGDAWEHADDPDYPAVMTGAAYRLGVNYVVYATTH
ncbi:MAG: DUF4159 domain-containing protein [Acidobacteriota bacterium]